MVRTSHENLGGNRIRLGHAGTEPLLACIPTLLPQPRQILHNPMGTFVGEIDPLHVSLPLRQGVMPGIN